jgi:2'-5' RNA ligase
MRLFVAIELSEQERASLMAAQRKLASFSGVRMTRPENLHLTLRFVGKWPEERLDELKDALGGVALPTAPLSARLAGLRFLPGPHYPRVLAASVEAPQRLRDLQTEIEQTVRNLGIQPERKPFAPHVTLGRVREPKQAGALVESVARIELAPTLIEAHGFALISSELLPEGPRYETLERWRFLKSKN